MKVLVTGTYSFEDVNSFINEMDAIHAGNPITEVMHGGLYHVDAMARVWARKRNIKTTDVNKTHVPAPGFRRQLPPSKKPVYDLKKLKPDLILVFQGPSEIDAVIDDAGKENIPYTIYE